MLDIITLKCNNIKHISFDPVICPYDPVNNYCLVNLTSAKVTWGENVNQSCIGPYQISPYNATNIILPWRYSLNLKQKNIMWSFYTCYAPDFLNNAASAATKWIYTAVFWLWSLFHSFCQLLLCDVIMVICQTTRSPTVAEDTPSNL